MSDFEMVSETADNLQRVLRERLGNSLISVGIMRVDNTNNFKIVVKVANEAAAKSIPYLDNRSGPGSIPVEARVGRIPEAYLSFSLPA